jgi:hypothetical protein
MIWTPLTDTICTICGTAFAQADRRTGSLFWYTHETCSRHCDLVWRESSPEHPKGSSHE